MKHVKQDRKAVALLRKSPRPALHTWAASRVFNRTKGKKYGQLVSILQPVNLFSFCASIGWVEVNWALYESQLVNWCQIMFVTFGWRGSGRASEKEFPKPYSRKVRYLRSGFEGLPEFHPFKEKGLALLERAATLSNIRDDLTHGVITSLEPKDGKFFLEGKTIHKDGRHEIRTIVMDAHRRASR